uniref:Uncharacterized protein n=1 Tax=Anopheles minimus TaxID=112268 RepID=A0A182WPJ1_9DIPT
MLDCTNTSLIRFRRGLDITPLQPTQHQ